QIFSLQQDKYRDDQNDEGSLKRVQDRRENPLGDLQRSRIWLVYLDRDRWVLARLVRSRGGARIGRLTFALTPNPLSNPGRNLGQLTDREILHGVDFFSDRACVSGKIRSETGDLDPNDAAQSGDNAEREHYREQHSRHPRQVQPAEQANDWA